MHKNIQPQEMVASLETHQFAAEVRRMGAIGVQRAQEDSRNAGVPLVYSINGILHWELPDGSLTTKDPWEGQPLPSKPIE